MLKKLLLAIIIFNSVFIPSLSFALDCQHCSVGSCFCNIPECNTGTFDIYNTPCTGIPKKEYSFTNGFFSWNDIQSQNYYFQALCDSGNKTNCLNVNLQSQTTTSSVTTIISSITTTVFTNPTTSSPATAIKPTCPFQCCFNELNYQDRACPQNYDCLNNYCVSRTTSTVTKAANSDQSGMPTLWMFLILLLVIFFGFIIILFSVKRENNRIYFKRS